MEEDIKKLRDTEDLQIMEHLKAIIEIVRTKCDRCKNPFCQGCTFSPGDGLKGNLAEALKYMRIQNNDKFAEVFYPIKPKSFVEDEDLFDNLMMEVRR